MEQKSIIAGTNRANQNRWIFKLNRVIATIVFTNQNENKM